MLLGDDEFIHLFNLTGLTLWFSKNKKYFLLIIGFFFFLVNRRFIKD